ncbi:MAG: hypothetical protein ACP5VF_13630 [Acidobacteriota bacterium]
MSSVTWDPRCARVFRFCVDRGMLPLSLCHFMYGQFEMWALRADGVNTHTSERFLRKLAEEGLLYTQEVGRTVRFTPSEACAKGFEDWLRAWRSRRA